MADHAKMYAVLCVAVDKALTQLESIPGTEATRTLLQNALWQTEEMYVKEKPNIT